METAENEKETGVNEIDWDDSTNYEMRTYNIPTYGSQKTAAAAIDVLVKSGKTHEEAHKEVDKATIPVRGPQWQGTWNPGLVLAFCRVTEPRLNPSGGYWSAYGASKTVGEAYFRNCLKHHFDAARSKYHNGSNSPTKVAQKRVAAATKGMSIDELNAIIAQVEASRVAVTENVSENVSE